MHVYFPYQTRTLIYRNRCNFCSTWKQLNLFINNRSRIFAFYHSQSQTIPRYTVYTRRNTFSSNQQLTSWAKCGYFHSEEHQNGEQSFRRDSIASRSKHRAARAIGNGKIPCNPKRYAENSRARGGWCFVRFAFRYTWERMTRGYFSRRQCSWLLSGFAVRFFDGERRARFSAATWLHDEVSASVITCAPSLPRVSPLLREFTRSQIK